MILNRADFNVCTGEKVDDIQKGPDRIFTVITTTNQYRARTVVLALGRAGEPRKLGVKGEDLPKVMYRLIEADHYITKPCTHHDVLKAIKLMVNLSSQRKSSDEIKKESS